jgi:hypothetical protein
MATPDHTLLALAGSIARRHRTARAHLYPKSSCRQLTANDTDAIYAYVKSRPPIRQQNRANSFPFDYVRPTLALFW